MKTQIKNDAKTAKNAKNAKSSLDTLNLEKMAEKISDRDIKERGKRDDLYIYPDGFNKEKDGKKFRGGMRRKLQTIFNDLFYAVKQQNPEKIKDAVSKFDAHYANYRVNDYSFASLSQSAKDDRKKDIEDGLQIIKEIKGMK